MIDVDKLIERLRAMAWYSDLAVHEAELISELGVHPAAAEEAHIILVELDRKNGPWAGLRDEQVKAHIMRTIGRKIDEAKQHVGLNNNDWFRNLAPDYTAQNQVRQTVDGMRRIHAALRRTARRVDEKSIEDSNPWSRLLHSRPHAARVLTALAKPAPKKPRPRRQAKPMPPPA